MKRQIRYNTFETNSSSAHSLVIQNEDLVKEIYEDTHYTSEDIVEELLEHRRLTSDKTIFRAWKDEEWCYGRHPFKVLYTFIDKYMFAWSCYARYQNTHDEVEKIQELKSILKKYVPTLTEIQNPGYGYVDEVWMHYWERYFDNLEEFLTNRKYIVICDGDEYCVFTDLANIGAIDLNNHEIINYERYYNDTHQNENKVGEI